LSLLNTNTKGGSADPDYISGVGKGKILLRVLSYKLLDEMFSLLKSQENWALKMVPRYHLLVVTEL
jgi:hypothetical protein